MSANSIPGESFLPGLKTAAFCVLTWQRDGDREPKHCRRFLIREFYHEDPTLMTSSKPDHLPKALPANTILLGIRASACEWGSTVPSKAQPKWYLCEGPPLFHSTTVCWIPAQEGRGVGAWAQQHRLCPCLHAAQVLIFF